MDRLRMLTAAIFDVDGAILVSPHERVWREALRELADPERFTTTMYQAAVAGKPRLSGALAALEAFGCAEHPEACSRLPARRAGVCRSIPSATRQVSDRGQ
jgi:beta-phosphoglucomutase